MMAPLWPRGIRRQEFKGRDAEADGGQETFFWKVLRRHSCCQRQVQRVAPWLQGTWSPSLPILQRLVCLEALSLMGFTR